MNLRKELLKLSRQSSIKELALKMQISAPYLCRVISGQKPPSKKVLSFMGYKKQVIYIKETK